MKRIVALVLMLIPLLAAANDGIYYVSGNHLIPITETDISVRKEVLTITRVGDRFMVDVYYEFFNPVAEKTLLVGFEAADPYPCYNPEVYEKALPYHPFIYDFTVEMNGQKLDYEVAHVDFRPAEWKKRNRVPEYYVGGRFLTIDVKDRLDTLRENENYMCASINYAYHFQARFQPGLNIIHHTYQYKASIVNIYDYYLPYVLTAANRWANRQIDDFTLILDMGDRQSFFVRPYFFNTFDEWQIEGAGRMNNYTEWGDEVSAMFHIRHGKAVFHKMNFHPEGELDLYSPASEERNYYYSHSIIEKKEDFFNIIGKHYYKPWAILSQKDNPFDPKAFTYTRDERRILRNLPFAQRGYRFKNATLQAFYNATDWYTPDSSYTPDLDSLTPDERRWVDLWSE